LHWGTWATLRQQLQHYHVTGEGIINWWHTTKQEEVSNLLHNFQNPVHLYRQTNISSPPDIIICQSIIRHHAAINEKVLLCNALCTKSATVIQTKWRGFNDRKNFTLLCFCLIRLQSSIRQWSAKQRFNKSKSSATKLATCWRGHRQRKVYTHIIRGAWNWSSRLYLGDIWLLTVYSPFYLKDVTLCQSFVRSLVARQRLYSLLHKRRVISATAIQRIWRLYRAAGCFHKIKCSAILLQAATRRYQAMKVLIEYTLVPKMSAIWALPAFLAW
jgi:hypothetical protein